MSVGLWRLIIWSHIGFFYGNVALGVSFQAGKAALACHVLRLGPAFPNTAVQASINLAVDSILLACWATGGCEGCEDFRVWWPAGGPQGLGPPLVRYPSAILYLNRRR